MTTGQLGSVLGHLRTLAGSSAHELSDGQLLERFHRQRDQSAFAALVRRHGRLVWGVCRNVLHHDQDAEDAFQAAFLVLARQAGTVRKPESLGSWLHGVAYRVAMRAKRAAARRHVHEKVKYPAARAAGSPVSESAWRELQAALDEEVQALPERLRVPFVLCCLENRSQTDVAAQLGCKLSTVSSWLTRARKELLRRLARRGVSLSAALAAVALSQEAASAALPALLAQSTVRAATAYAAGATLSAHLAALVKGASQTMHLGKMKIATILFIAASVVTAACGLARSSASGDEAKATSPKSTEQPASAKQQTGKDDQEALTYAGRVLGPDGKPLAGAKLYLTLSWSYIKRPEPSPVHAVTDEEGRYRFSVPKTKFGQFATTVVAAADGYGAAWEERGPRGKSDDLTLKLVKDDVPITGQVVDLQGKPLAGVTVRVLNIRAAAGEDIGPWLAAVKTRTSQGMQLESELLRRQLLVPELPGLPQQARTDADGKFRLTGIGRDRLVLVRIEGPTIATQDLRILTRAGKNVDVPESEANPEYGMQGLNTTYYPASFRFVAGPTKPIIGVVRDRDTKQPLASVSIRSYKLANNPIHGLDIVQTTTDAQGRYRLTGMPKGPDNKIVVVPRNDQPYLVVHAVVPDTAGFDAVTVDFDLKRGIWIEGKITDKATGKPLQGHIQYYALINNPHLRDQPGFEGTFFQTPGWNVREDGSYRVVGLPGPGLVVVQWSDHYYLLAHERDDADGTKENILNTAPFALSPGGYNALAGVDPPKDAERFTRNITLDPGETFQGMLVGPDGKPVTQARSYGLTGWDMWQLPLEKAEFTVRAFNPRRPRAILFHHAEKRLVGKLEPPADKSKPVTVTMQPGATVTGRLVDADGRPRANVTLGTSFQGNRVMASEYVPNRVQTDKDGRFRIDALLPGFEYSFNHPSGYMHFGGDLKSGETKDLGDVQLKRSGE